MLVLLVSSYSYYREEYYGKHIENFCPIPDVTRAAPDLGGYVVVGFLWLSAINCHTTYSN